MGDIFSTEMRIYHLPSLKHKTQVNKRNKKCSTKKKKTIKQTKLLRENLCKDYYLIYLNLKVKLKHLTVNKTNYFL